MKTTVDIPDALYTTIAAASAASGQSVESFLLAAAREKAVAKTQVAGEGEKSRSDSASLTNFDAWWDNIPKADPKAVAEVQQIIDAEFSKIDPKDWE